MLKEILEKLIESGLLSELEKKIKDLVAKKGDTLKIKIGEYLAAKTPAAKDKLVTFLFENVKLPFPINLFKKTIKKTINKKFDKLIQKILIELNK